VKAELTYLLSSLHNTCNNVYSKLFFAKPVLPKISPLSPLLLKEKESEEKKKFPKQKNCKI